VKRKKPVWTIERPLATLNDRLIVYRLNCGVGCVTRECAPELKAILRRGQRKTRSRKAAK
jgi:hypothetical protein